MTSKSFLIVGHLTAFFVGFDVWLDYHSSAGLSVWFVLLLLVEITNNTQKGAVK